MFVQLIMKLINRITDYNWLNYIQQSQDVDLSVDGALPLKNNA